MRSTDARVWWRRRSPSGQGLIEFVLVMPMVLMLFFGIYEFGHYYSTRLSVRHTVREAARFAITGNVLQDSIGQPLTRQNSIQQVILTSSPHIHIDPNHIVLDPADGGGPGELVHIDVRYDYVFMMPGLRSLFPNGTVPIRVSTVVKNERF